MIWLFSSEGQSIGTLAPVLPVNIQDWFPLGGTGLISLQSKGLPRVLQHHSSAQLSHPYVTTGKSILAWRTPWSEEPGGLQSVGSQRVGPDWRYLAHIQDRGQWYLNWSLHPGLCASLGTEHGACVEIALRGPCSDWLTRVWMDEGANDR